MFFLSLFFVVSDTFFLFFFLVRILRGFWPIQKKTKKVSEKNKKSVRKKQKKVTKKTKIFGKNKKTFFQKKASSRLRGEIFFFFQKKMKKKNIFL